MVQKIAKREILKSFASVLVDVSLLRKRRKKRILLVKLSSLCKAYF